jgi:hypothetical protein
MLIPTVYRRAQSRRTFRFHRVWRQAGLGIRRFSVAAGLYLSADQAWCRTGLSDGDLGRFRPALVTERMPNGTGHRVTVLYRQYISGPPDRAKTRYPVCHLRNRCMATSRSRPRQVLYGRTSVPVYSSGSTSSSWSGHRDHRHKPSFAALFSRKRLPSRTYRRTIWTERWPV